MPYMTTSPARILVTRAPKQGSTLAGHLRAHGLEPVLLPTIEIAEPTSFAPLDAALAHLDTFHWLLFTSANAAEALANRLSPLQLALISHEAHPLNPVLSHEAHPLNPVLSHEAPPPNPVLSHEASPPNPVLSHEAPPPTPVISHEARPPNPVISTGARSAEWRDPCISPASAEDPNRAPQTSTTPPPKSGVRPPALPESTTQHPGIAAIGPATARALEAIGLTPNLVPSHAVAESLAEALLPYVRQPDGTPTRFLLIRAEEAREHLPETLRAAGAEVTIAPAYRSIIPAGSLDLIRNLFAPEPPDREPPDRVAPDRVPHASKAPPSMSGVFSADPSPSPIHAITFTSASTARNLLALCEAANVTLPEAALRISIGPITSQTLRDLGLPPHAEAPEATVASLAQTVVNSLHAQKPR